MAEVTYKNIVGKWDISRNGSSVTFGKKYVRSETIKIEVKRNKEIEVLNTGSIYYYYDVKDNKLLISDMIPERNSKLKFNIDVISISGNDRGYKVMKFDKKGMGNSYQKSRYRACKIYESPIRKVDFY